MVLNTLITLLLLPTQIHTLPKLIHRPFITTMVPCLLILVLWIMLHHFNTIMVLCLILVTILMITNINLLILTLILLNNQHYSSHTLALPPIMSHHPLIMIISDPLPHLFTRLLLFMTLWVVSVFPLIILHTPPALTMDDLITPFQLILIICLTRAGLIPHIVPVCRLFPPLVKPP